MPRTIARRALPRTAPLLIMLAAIAGLATGCARTSWNRSNAAGPSVVLHPDAQTPVRSPMASAPELN